MGFLKPISHKPEGDDEMLEILRRELIYIWYYFELQLRQILPYWLLGILIGSIVSVFIGNKIHGLVRSLSDKSLALFPQAFWESHRRCVCMEQSPLRRPFPKAECGMTGWLLL